MTDARDGAATAIQARIRGIKARNESAMRKQGPATDASDELAVAVPPALSRRAVSVAAAGAAWGLSPQATVTRGDSSPGRPVCTNESVAEMNSCMSINSGLSSNLACDQLRLRLLMNPTRLPPSIQKLRIDLYLLFEQPGSSRAARYMSVFLFVAIVVSTLSLVLETMPELRPHISRDFWFGLEVVCTGIFTWEYVVRISVCNVTGKSACRFLKAPLNLIDLGSIVPFYVWFILMQSDQKFGKALSILRMIRLVRLFRIFKLGRYSSGLQLVIQAMRKSSQAAIVLTVFLGIGIVVFSSLIFYVEKLGCPYRHALAGARVEGSSMTKLEDHVAQCRGVSGMSDYGLCCNDNDAPVDYPNIIAAFWWSIVTIMTVGFGDLYPRTLLGRMVGTLTMLAGILLIALSIAILGLKFQEVYQEHQIKVNGKQEQADRRVPKEMKDLQEMGRRLRLMPLGDELGGLAYELADELEVLGEMKQEIKFMQERETAKQRKVLTHFDTLVTMFLAATTPVVKAKSCVDLKIRAKVMSRNTFANMLSKSSERSTIRGAHSEPQLASKSKDAQLPGMADPSGKPE